MQYKPDFFYYGIGLDFIQISIIRDNTCNLIQKEVSLENLSQSHKPPYDTNYGPHFWTQA